MSKTFQEYITHQQQPRADPAEGNAPCEGELRCNFKIAKSDDEQRLVFGWASVAERADGETVVDWQEDIVEMPELEQAAYKFVQLYREGSEMHERGGFDIAILVESMVFTEEKLALLNIPAGTIPHGWWVGFLVTDDDVWAKVKDGTYRMFSIEGEAVREKV
jgi:hypothetical protein